jgi:hypothetical protein
MKLKHALLAVAGLGFAICMSASGSLISGSVVALDGDTTVDLTAYGTTDWAYWSGSSATKNEKITGGDVISAASAVGGTGLQGSTSSSSYQESRIIYTDGTTVPSYTTLPGGQISGVFNKSYNNTGVGISLTVTLPTTDLYTIYLWTGAYDATGELTVSLDGATSYVDSSTTTVLADTQTFLYTLTVQGDEIDDVVNIQMLTSVLGGGTSYGRASIAAIAVQAVPEPATMGMLALGMLALMGVRRLQR